MKEVVSLTPNMYNYLMENGCVDQKNKGQKEV